MHTHTHTRAKLFEWIALYAGVENCRHEDGLIATFNSAQLKSLDLFEYFHPAAVGILIRNYAAHSS